MLSEGRVGPGVLADGATNEVRLDKSQSLVTQDSRARYHECVYRGKVYSLTNGYAGTTLVAASAIGQTAWNPAVGLYNPPNSGVNLVVVAVIAQYVSGTPTAGGLVLGYVAPPAGVTAPGGNGAVNMLTLQTGGSIARTFAQSAMTGSAASIMLLPLTTSPFAGAVAATTPLGQWEELAGLVICPPGGAIGISGTLGTSTVVQAGLVWEEVSV